MQYYVENISSADQTEIYIEGDENHHLVRVKRVDPGDRIKFFNGKGLQGEGEIVSTSKQRSLIKVLELFEVKKATNQITLFVATPKGKAFSFLIEKAVEAGVNRIVPVQSDRSEKSFVDRKADKLEKAVLEACKQCEQAYLPEVGDLMDLKSSFALPNESTSCFLMHTKGGISPVKMIQNVELNQSIAIWIGSEGGWSDSEILLAQEAELTICTLPMPIMRVETAVIVTIGLVRVLIDKGL